MVPSLHAISKNTSPGLVLIESKQTSATSFNFFRIVSFVPERYQYLPYMFSSGIGFSNCSKPDSSQSIIFKEPLPKRGPSVESVKSDMYKLPKSNTLVVSFPDNLHFDIINLR